MINKYKLIISLSGSILYFCFIFYYLYMLKVDSSYELVNYVGNQFLTLFV